MDGDEQTPNQLEVIGRGRRRKMPDKEIRDRMFGAARDMLEVHGLTVSVEHLTFEDVIRDAGVSRSAAYRLWQTRDAFYADLLVNIASPEHWVGTAALDQETKAEAINTILANTEDLETAEGRRRVLKSAIRRTIDKNFSVVRHSAHWHTYVALTATLISMPESEVKSRIASALQRSETSLINDMVEFYAVLADALGLRLRKAFEGDFSSLAASGAAIVEGLSLRHMVVPEYVDRLFLVTEGEEQEEWSLPALTYLGLIDLMTEPDPDYEFERSREQLLQLIDGEVAPSK